MQGHRARFALLGGIALASCSGGGGGSGATISVGFERPGSSAAEGSSASVALVLTLPNVVPLEQDLEVTVSASGTSTPGADHDVVGSPTLTFPAGSPTGTRILLGVNVAADALVEGGDETLVLTLAAPSAGGLGAAVHTLDILETDFARVAFGEPSSRAMRTRSRSSSCWLRAIRSGSMCWRP